MASSARAQDPGPVERIAADPLQLRDERVYRDLVQALSEAYSPLMRRLATDRAQPWDIRARALSRLYVSDSREAYASFAADFDPVAAAARDDGAAALCFLASWLPRHGAEREAVEPLLLPGEQKSRVPAVLAALAGRPAEPYLRLLVERGFRIDGAAASALAATDDQDTRRLVAWYVGEQRMVGMEPFLVAQLESQRPCSYPDQGGRLLEAAFTAGISELFRAAVLTPLWLGEETTPKSLALQSLAALVPASQPIADRTLPPRLLTVAADNAAGRDRAQWQLAADLLLFLAERREPLGSPGAEAMAALVRQCLRSRGPLPPLVLVEKTCRPAALPMPKLADAELERLWKVAHSTLNAPFLGALVRGYPDAGRRAELEQHLLAQSAQAADGSLRVVRCWGADIETPGDWSLAVAELGLDAALPTVKKVLDSAFRDQAIAALTRFGSAGAPPLARFLTVEEAATLKPTSLRAALEHCACHLPVEQLAALTAPLLADPRTRDATEEALAMGHP